MIKRIETPLYRHAITTYDFEWNKREWKKDARGRHRSELAFIIGGAYDERGYRWYTSLESFIMGELTPENAGRRFYGHFSGASDMVFLIRILARHKDWEIKGLFSGSSAIMVSVTDRMGRRWTFLDSFWTMRVGLATIGEWTGDAKDEFDHTREHSLAEWRTYNEQDCKVLHGALTNFQEIVNDRGGELRVTGASTALDLFLRRYLKRPIDNWERIGTYVRPAYIASKVQKYRDSCQRANVYDINSSFPWSMTGDLPGDLLGTSHKLPTRDGALWVADVDVKVPQQYLPPLPARLEGDNRIYFPTGNFRTRITSEDFLCGDFDIAKVYSCWEFDPCDDMRQFAEDLFGMRAGGGFQSQVWKIIVNSLYGKWGEREDKEILIVNPHEWTPALQMIGPHIYLGEESKTIEHAHVPFSAFITARSRRKLREIELEAYRQGPLYYSDTDSVFCAATLATGKGLGELKHEYSILAGLFEGSKLYALEKDLPLCYRDEKRFLAKAKGFSRVVSEGGEGEKRLSYEDFWRIQEGESVVIERMRRLKELVRENGGFDFEPDLIRQEKQLRFPKPKRAPTSDGDSRPWDVEELRAALAA